MLINKITFQKDYYFKSLITELSNQGIKTFIQKKQINKFPFFSSLLSSKCKILHIHWMPIAGYSKKNILKIILKLIQLILDTYLTKYILKAKIVWTIHNLYSHETYYPRLEKVGRRFLSKKVDLIISHCISAKVKISQEYKVSSNKIFVIPHGNYFQCYKNNITKEKARDKLNLKKEDFVFLHFGRIRPYKGIDILVNNFNSLETNKRIKLLIVGKCRNKSLKSYLLKASEQNKNIILKFGYIPDNEIQIYMNAADIVVIYYKEILTSGETLLAISFGKPIIAPRLGCINDILDDDGSILYNVSDKTGLITALKTGIKKGNDLAKMGKYNMELAKNFDWKLIGKQTKELYDKI